MITWGWPFHIKKARLVIFNFIIIKNYSVTNLYDVNLHRRDFYNVRKNNYEIQNPIK